jgi:hypothetical protein
MFENDIKSQIIVVCTSLHKYVQTGIYLLKTHIRLAIGIIVATSTFSQACRNVRCCVLLSKSYSL